MSPDDERRVDKEAFEQWQRQGREEVERWAHEQPTPPPNKPPAHAFVLTLYDREFLRSLRIQVE